MFHCYEIATFHCLLGGGSWPKPPKPAPAHFSAPGVRFLPLPLRLPGSQGGFLVFLSPVTHHYWTIGLEAQSGKPQGYEKVVAQSTPRKNPGLQFEPTEQRTPEWSVQTQAWGSEGAGLPRTSLWMARNQARWNEVKLGEVKMPHLCVMSSDSHTCCLLVRVGLEFLLSSL